MQTHDRMLLTVMTRRFFPSFVLSTEPFPPRLCLGKSRPEYRGSFYLSLCVLFILRRLEGRKPRPPALEKNKKNTMQTLKVLHSVFKTHTKAIHRLAKWRGDVYNHP